MEEIWKPIKGYEGKYEVSNLGRVKSFLKGKPRIMRYHITKFGYYRIWLIKNKIYNSFQMHQLVANAFIPNPENKPQVNHIDSNRLNNDISNLEWVTAKENMQHAMNKGRIASGEKSGRSKLTTKQVIEILARLKNKETGLSIAKSYAVVDSCISSIKNGITWNHITNLPKCRK